MVSSCCLVAVFVCTTMALWQVSSSFSLNILHSENLRGEFMPVDSFGTVCPMFQAESSFCSGGIARIKKFIQLERQRDSNTVAIHSGGFFFGSTFFSLRDSTLAASYFNDTGFDFLGLSTADFFGGKQALADFINSAANPNVPAVLSNVNVTLDAILGANRVASPPNTPLIAPFAVKNVDGQDVGYISYVTTDLSARVDGLGSGVVAMDAVNSVLLAVYKLKKSYPNCKVIILSCGDAQVFDVLVSSVYEVDVFLLTGQVFASDSVPAPQVVQNLAGETSLVIRTTEKGVRVGQLSAVFDFSGKLQSYSYTYVKQNSSIVLEPTLWNRVKLVGTVAESTYGATLATMRSTAFGEPGSDFTGEGAGCRYTDCPMGRIFTEALYAACPSCDLTFINAGAIRGSLFLGALNTARLIQVHPFVHNVTIGYITGARLLEVLKNGVSRETGLGRLLHFKNLRYAFNRLAETEDSQRLVFSQVFNTTTNLWTAIRPSAVYKFATTAFLTNGGDHNTVLRDNAMQLQDTKLPVRTAVANYLTSTAGVPSLSPIAMSILVAACVDGILPFDSNSSCLITPTYETADAVQICPTNADLCRSLASEPEGIFDGAVNINATQCRYCSGLGSCINDVCVCSVPTSGRFDGVEVTRGVDCSDLRSVYSISPGVVWSVVVFSALGILFVLVLIVFFVIYRNHRLIRSTSPLLSLLSILGGGLALASNIVLVLQISPASCTAWTWLLAMGYLLLFVPLYLKAFQLYQKLHRDPSKDSSISETALLWVLAFIVLVDLFVLILFSTTSTYRIGVGTLSERDWAVFEYCVSDSSTVYAAVLFTYRAILLIWGCVISFYNRKIPGDVMERWPITASIYNSLCVLIISITVLYLVVSVDPSVFYAFLFYSCLYICVFTLVALYGRRAYYVYASLTGPKFDHANSFYSDDVYSPNLSLQPSANPTSAEELQREIRRLETMLRNFQS